MTDTLQTVRKWLDYLKNTHGLTYDEIAEKMNVSKDTLASYRRDDRKFGVNSRMMRRFMDTFPDLRSITSDTEMYKPVDVIEKLHKRVNDLEAKMKDMQKAHDNERSILLKTIELLQKD